MTKEALSRVGQPSKRRRILTRAGEVVVCALGMGGFWLVALLLDTLVHP